MAEPRTIKPLSNEPVDRARQLRELRLMKVISAPEYTEEIGYIRLALGMTQVAQPDPVEAPPSETQEKW